MKYERRSLGSASPIPEEIPNTPRIAAPRKPWQPKSPTSEAVAQDLNLDGKPESRTVMETGPKGAPKNRDISRGGTPNQKQTGGSLKDTMSREEYEEHLDQLLEGFEEARTTVYIERDGSQF